MNGRYAWARYNRFMTVVVVIAEAGNVKEVKAEATAVTGGEHQGGGGGG